ncbi:MAG: hypothetical protein HC933_19750 [Pleurocapsa sp. SU_196_0]|nr:hypothetical protein [Pleurocapsa sp. SU_196_0]
MKRTVALFGLTCLAVLSACAPNTRPTSSLDREGDREYASTLLDNKIARRGSTTRPGGTSQTGGTSSSTTSTNAPSALSSLFPPKVGQVWRLTIEETGVWRLRFLEVDSLGTATGNASTANKVTRTSASTLQSGVRRFIVAENPLTFVCDFAPNAVRVDGGNTLVGGRAFESRNGQLVALERNCNARLSPDD